MKSRRKSGGDVVSRTGEGEERGWEFEQGEGRVKGERERAEG